jgi:hypothetical protein
LAQPGEPQIFECRFSNVDVAVGVDRRHFGVLRFDIRQSAVCRAIQLAAGQRRD